MTMIRMNLRRLSICVFVLAAVAECSRRGPAQPIGVSPAAAPAAGLIGLDRLGMDPGVKPGDDFFAYANGGWVRSQEIPPDRSSFGIHEMLAELTLQRIAGLINEAAKADTPAGSDEQKIGDFYASFMDEAGIEQRGIEPLKPVLDRIAAIGDAAGLARALGETLRADVDVLNNTRYETDNIFGLWVA
jgi:predicted metalloendopeptidase